MTNLVSSPATRKDANGMLTFDLYTCHADGRFYLDGRERGRKATEAVESFYGCESRPLSGAAFRLSDGRTVKAIEDAREDAWAGFSGRVRPVEAHAVSTPGQRPIVTRESLQERLGPDVAIPEHYRPTRRDREAAMRELARAGLGTYPDGWPSIGVTCQTVGAFGGHTPPRLIGARPAERSSFAGTAMPGGADVAPGPSVVSYSERPQGCRSERPLDSLVRRVALSRARRLARR